ncbi:uncharacterized protein OCT59_021073 [Rhizophagus irregularis]|uniref:Uncharacterized protein n=1 Tax=Rhizophagus irregularis TaxID=588596 RepID=A0A915Z3A3_9GLOM|nr:hypothetical protein OCT59_021073 [Rhizophagus irregularis]CAB5359849.1 unnamed protein product [Rhizophagus irregularis]
MVDTTLGHAIESVVSMYPRYSDISSRRWRLLPAYNAVLALQLESRTSTILKTAINQRRERLEENSADEDKVDKSRSSSMESRKEEQTQIKISSKEVTEFITDDNKESQMTNRRV